MGRMIRALLALLLVASPVAAEPISISGPPIWTLLRMANTWTGQQTFVAPVLGAATGTSLALGGATIGTDALAWTGTATGSGALTAASFIPTGSTVPTNGMYLSAANTLSFASNSVSRLSLTTSALNTTVGINAQGNIIAQSGFFIGFNNDSSTYRLGAASDVILSRGGAASLQLGLGDTDLNSAIVAQTLRTQGALTGGTSNQAGKDFTVIVSPGKGTGAGGDFIIQTSAPGSSGASINAPATRLIADYTGITVPGTIPVVTGTGTPTITTGSSDTAGEVTAGATATSVIITFSATKTNAPFCIVTPQTQLLAFAYTVSTSAITITQTATSGNLINYHCFQR